MTDIEATCFRRERTATMDFPSFIQKWREVAPSTVD